MKNLFGWNWRWQTKNIREVKPIIHWLWTKGQIFIHVHLVWFLLRPSGHWKQHEMLEILVQRVHREHMKPFLLRKNLICIPCFLRSTHRDITLDSLRHDADRISNFHSIQDFWRSWHQTNSTKQITERNCSLEDKWQVLLATKKTWHSSSASIWAKYCGTWK